MSWQTTKPGLIPSLDVSVERLSNLLSGIDEIRVQNRNPIHALKVGALLELEGLKTIISKIREYSNLPIIIDHQKLADIPSIIKKYVEKIASIGVDGAILLGYVGPTSITTFVESCQEQELASYIVAEMSHDGASTYIKEESPIKIAKLARDLKATGIVCPATRTESIQRCAEVLKGSLLGIMSPGHGPQGGGADSAVMAGADWIVVGRSFYNSQNPQETLIKLGKLIIDKWKIKNSEE
ncbi:MAG: orotidine 5'-phosphate decarboxylase [Candidatus Helarchaeota archaeon]|nr:orotidine 5'-phosphate decarboxylase [Candidatus Helarchaeota archaeon]